ncbi:MAG: nitrilase-related carbon-nitrogen hydrolase [Anaerolineae bacterium]
MIMANPVVACAQQQMRLFDSIESYRKELGRFLYMARAKGAQLAVFPALSGVMAASYRAQGFGVGLLKQADARKRSDRSLWARARNALASGTASLIGVSFRQAFAGLLQSDPAGLAADYTALFAELARAYEMTIVAGSAYLPNKNGVIRHRTLVFGPDGTLLGHHDKLALSQEDAGLATAGDAWHVIATPVGRIGILLGEEALYPEAGRVLAYQGAELLVALAAVSDEALAAYIRHGIISRAQENRIFALSSFLVGKHYLAIPEAPDTLKGRSGIYAPLELTVRYTGVLVEMGAADAEGLLAAELDQVSLRKYWEQGVEPVRKRMPVDIFAAYLPALYSSRRTLAEAWPEAGGAVPLAVQPGAEEPRETAEEVEPAAEPAQPPEAIAPAEQAAPEQAGLRPA